MGTLCFAIVMVAIFFIVVFACIGASRGCQQSIIADPDPAAVGQSGGYYYWGGVFLVTTSFQAGNSIGVGIAIGEATETAPAICVMIFNVIGISLLFFRSFNKMLKKLMISMVILILFSFVTTLFTADPDITVVANGFVPSMAEGSLELIIAIAFTASCFSIMGAFSWKLRCHHLTW